MNETADQPDAPEDGSIRERTKIGHAIQRWLAGELSADQCLDRVYRAGYSDGTTEIWHYLRTHVCLAGDSARKTHRPDVERVLLFLQSRAEYLWPEVLEPKVLIVVNCSLGCLGGLAMTLIPLIGLILAIFLGSRWLFYAVLLPLVAGAGLLGWYRLFAGYFARRYVRGLQSMWASPGAHSDKQLDFSVYPFANRAQMQEVLASCPAVQRPLPDLEAEEKKQEELTEDPRELAKRREGVRVAELTEILRANPRRCPNCGSERRNYHRPPGLEKYPIETGRKCKDCGCVWIPPWKPHQAWGAIIVGTLFVGMGTVLTCVWVYAAINGELRNWKAWAYLALFIGAVASGVYLFVRGLGRLKGTCGLGDVIEASQTSKYR